MKKFYFLFLLVLAAAFTQAQQILLYSETFENGSNDFLFDSVGPGSNTGNNNWVVNNLYTGQPQYPNTPGEDSVVSGTIFGAPNSHYLHIHDIAATGGIGNANWNTHSVSDRFCYLGSSFCTLGLTDVTLAFFWICQGDSAAGAYGQVYYSADGGPWTATGRPKYCKQSKWKYETISDPAFSNVQNLRFGFRWVNPNTNDSSTISFGLDDIIAVGTYDNVNNPVTIHTSILDTQICQGDQIIFYMALSQPMCDGDYQIQMSNASGNFSSPYNLGFLSLGAGFTAGYFASLGTPGNLSGSCFRLRVVRTGPQPVIISDTSVCFSMIHCPNLIYNVNAPVLHDADTTCIESVIDVMFNSTGVYGSSNTYTAQLSDSTGSFSNPYTLGTLHVRDSFPSTPPGNISGLIPANVPPGCGYYIRVVSNNPIATSTPVGPYCLVQCDELTNNHTDMHFCVASGPYPECDSFRIQRNTWNNQASYDTCNSWRIELRDMMTFGLVNSGGLGIFHDTAGGYYTLCMPSTPDSLPVAPGTYYMRILSNCSNEAWNETGSVIRITIGAPNTNPPVLTLGDSVVCNSGAELIEVIASPFNSPPSQYEWSSNLLNNGNSFIWPYNPLYVTLNPNVLPGDYRFYVQEINYGCVGPSSAPAIVTIIGPPSTHINGPLVVCLGDTVDYNVTYLRDTYYQWRSSNGVQILDASNSESRMIFDSLGTFTISNIVTNRCITGNDTGTYTVTVISPYTVNLGPDQRVCQYTPLNLTAQSNSLNKGLLTQTTGRQTTPGGMFNIIAHDDVTIDSFAVIFNGTHTNLQEQIYGKQGSYRGSETNVGAWSFNTSYFNFATSGLNQLTTIPAYIGQHLAPGDTFAYYLVNVNSPVVSQYYDNGIGIQQGTVYSSDGVIDIVQGTVNSSLFGAFVGPYILDLKVYYSTKAGEHFIWNTGDTTATILFNPTHDTTLVVTLYDTSGCRNTDTLNIAVDIVPIVDAGPDTLLCPLVNYTMQGTSNNPNINWQPAAGLSNTNTLNPVFNYYQTQRYFLIATDTLGCNGTDSVLISVDRIDVDAGPDTTICDGETFQLAGSSSADNIVWSPATGLSDVSILAPVFSADHGGVYLLSATDTLGCTLSDSVSIEVKICDTYIQVPSAFTPNGDGNNDFFTVFGKYISDYEIRIYNRWGEEVYHSTDLNELSDLSRGWDGTYKGKKQDSGTFVYYIVAKDINGKTITKKGNLTLIR